MPSRSVSALAAMAAAALSVACSVDVEDWRGYACDDAHPCLEGRVCHPQTSRCVEPGADGGLEADGGLVDVGVTWRQAVQGFADTRTCSGGCSVNIDSVQGNAITAQVPAASAVEAYAIVETPRLPTSPEGRARGYLQFLSGLPSAETTLVLLETSANTPILRLSVDSAGALHCHAAALTLSGAAVSAQSAPGIVGGQAHLVEAAWRQGGFLRVWVDGQLACDAAVPSFSSATVTMRELWLGISNVGGTPSSGFSVLLRGWKISSVPDTALTDEG